MLVCQNEKGENWYEEVSRALVGTLTVGITYGM